MRTSRKGTIKLLEHKLAEITRLKEMPCDDNSDSHDFKLLRNYVENIVEKESGRNSSEYKKIPIMPIRTLTFQTTEAELRQEYHESLESWEIYLESVIEKYKNITVADDIKICFKKAWYEIKDFAQGVIAKYFAEKTRFN
jgi:hypothetical protein